MKPRYLICLITYLILYCVVLTAQDYQISKIEDKAKQKYITNNSKKEFRYRENITIKQDEYIDGNIVVVNGNLSVKGEVIGDILVIYGDIKVKDNALVDGNTTAVNGRIYQGKNAKITGNQIETKDKNLISHEEWEDDHSNYDYCCGPDDDDWEVLLQGILYSVGRICPFFICQGIRTG